MNKQIKILVALVAFLIIVGALLVFSSSEYVGIRRDSMYVLFKSHVIKIIFALLVLILFTVIPYQNYKRFSKLALFGAVILLVFTFLMGQRINGATRWLNLGIVKFQPSELAKIILLIHIAAMIEKKGELVKDLRKGLSYMVVWIVIVSGLIIIQPNVSTSIIVIISAFAVLYVGGAQIRQLVAAMTVMIIVGAAIAMILPHSRHRILGFLEHLSTGSIINSQVYQAKVALGSGGLFGVGLGHSGQSYGFIPEAYGDFIFSILGEEFGFIGTSVVLFVYLMIFFVGLKISKNTDDIFGQLLAFGLSFSIVLSAYINAGVISGILPTTGITLPFISYGGTSILIFSASVGIMINIAMQAEKKHKVIAEENE